MLGRARWRRLLGDYWQQHRHAGSVVEFAVYVDKTAVSGHNLVHSGEPESCAFARLGREKRLEDMSSSAGVHAGSVVFDGKQHTRKKSSGIAVQRLYFAVARTDEDLATLRHGIPGIEHKIQEDLLRLRGIDFEQTDIRIELEL